MLGWHQQDLMLLVPHNLLSKLQTKHTHKHKHMQTFLMPGCWCNADSQDLICSTCPELKTYIEVCSNTTNKASPLYFIYCSPTCLAYIDILRQNATMTYSGFAPGQNTKDDNYIKCSCDQQLLHALIILLVNNDSIVVKNAV